MSRGRGSGLARAETTTSWSALATIARSKGSVSSAVRRSSVRRSWMRTIRASDPSTPEVSPTMPTSSPTTTGLRPSSRARMAMTTRSGPAASAGTRVVHRPRSTAVTMPTTASSWAGRSFVRGRVPRRLGRTRTSRSS